MISLFLDLRIKGILLLIYISGFGLTSDAVEVTTVFPPGGSHSASTDTALIVTLHAPVDPGTVNDNTFIVHGEVNAPVNGSFTTDSNTFTFDPTLNFHSGEHIQASVTIGIESNGSPVNPCVWTFRIGVTNGTGIFADNGQLLGESESEDIVLGDLDGDGDLDAVVSSLGGTPNSSIWINNGAGMFEQGQIFESWGVYRLALGDLDGDGDLDIFFSDEEYPIWINDGNALFTSSGQSLINDCYAVSLGDLDGDGDLDAYIARGSDYYDQIWFNNGSGHFSDSYQGLGTDSSHDVSLGDLDNDGDLDAFVAVFWGANRVYLNQGNGILLNSGQNLGHDWSYGVDLGDFDLDGDLDAFVANSGDDRCSVYMNDGNGIFSESGQILDIYECWDVKTGDLDNDNDLDICLAREESNLICLNDGTGYFNVVSEIFSIDRNNGVSLGDLNGDGSLDAFFAVDGPFGGLPNRVYFNQCLTTPTTPPTDTPTPIPTNTSTPTPTETPTQLPSDTPTPISTATSAPPTSQPTYTPIATPTSSCHVLGVEIWMPSDYFSPGDPCELKVFICNPSSVAYFPIPLFVVLEIHGTYFYAPSFNEFDYFAIDVEPGISWVQVIPPFNWPTGTGSTEAVSWISAMTNPEKTEMFGSYDTFSFGWHD